MRLFAKFALHEKCPNTELFLVRIQSKCGKIRTRKNSVSGHFSRSVETDRLRFHLWKKFLYSKINFRTLHDRVVVHCEMPCL